MFCPNTDFNPCLHANQDNEVYMDISPEGKIINSPNLISTPFILLFIGLQFPYSVSVYMSFPWWAPPPPPPPSSSISSSSPFLALDATRTESPSTLYKEVGGSWPRFYTADMGPVVALVWPCRGRKQCCHGNPGRKRGSGQAVSDRVLIPSVSVTVNHSVSAVCYDAIPEVLWVP